ncbi:MAG: TonB-dependent receptor [Bacteriovorax sp.]|nr:TonB-dependent receptor [Bacteriovorax sp.]
MGLGQRQKALEINLNHSIYGTFAEIGAGQEVARHFFRAGGAAGTIAKSISAYDMTMSDAIYGKEKSGRYVCEERLTKMLDIEYEMLVTRLQDIRSSETRFFAFADTVSAKSFKGTGENHGWIGVKFQHKPKAQPSQVIMHVSMLDAENVQQQEALGYIGVNLIYAAYYLAQDSEKFIASLMDSLTTSRIQIDMISVTGDAFKGIDSRLLCLELVKNKLCEAVIFDVDGHVLQASEVLYKKNVLVVRGGYRPPTNLSLDMLECGLRKFKLSMDTNERENIIVIPEISMSLLLDRGVVDNEDFLARVDLLSALGQKVLISSSETYSDLNMFFTKYAKKKIAFVMASYNLEEILNKTRYEGNRCGLGLIGSVGKLVEPNTKLYIYPARDDAGSAIQTIESMNVSDDLAFLLIYLKENQLIEDILDYDPAVISIWSRRVLKMIQDGAPGWEKFVPASVAKTVKTKCLFGAKCDI